MIRQHPLLFEHAHFLMHTIKKNAIALRSRTSITADGLQDVLVSSCWQVAIDTLASDLKA